LTSVNPPRQRPEHDKAIVTSKPDKPMLDLIVNVGRASADSPLVRGALDLARRQQAYLTGLQLVPVYPSLMAVPEAITLLADEENQAQKRKDWWLELCRSSGVSGEWEVIRGIYAATLARRSQLADFVISELQVSDPDAPAGFDQLTHALFADVVPMLLVPDTWQGLLQAQRVLIAWNGSIEAAHAVKAALPLLARAAMVEVLDGERTGLPGISPPPLPLRDWLERHGVRAHWRPFPVEHDVGPAFQREAQSMRADLLVMGAWGRSRISELVLGGATRWMLENAAVPLFLAR
jgi:nucleotide-binding universal stress UspA family protein